MRLLARWAWVAVLGTALALSWWSLDALGRHYGVPAVLAGMVSATFDGAALVAADLAMRRAMVADAAVAVKVLMFGAVGLSAWLNAEHAVVLGYPIAARVLFAAPSVIAGWLFELQLRYLHRERLHALGRTAAPVPRFGFVVWLFHPWAALKRLSVMAASRLHSVPITVMDWPGAPMSVQELSEVQAEGCDPPAIVAASVESADDGARVEQASAVRTQSRAGRTPVPDELYMGKLRKLIKENGGVVRSVREVARRLSIGQERARRLIRLVEETETHAG